MESWKEELYHYGIKGMRWGVRRYQNYDGTYTQAGLKRYSDVKGTLDKTYSHRESSKAALKTAKSDYRTAKNKWEAKRAGDKQRKLLLYTGEDVDYKKVKQAQYSLENAKTEYKNSKEYVKEAKRLEKNEYKQLKNDYMADKGKALYRSGKTIEDISTKQRIADVAGLSILAAAEKATQGSNAFNRSGMSGLKLDRNAATAIQIGTIAVNAALNIKTGTDKAKLRAYYAHSTDRRNVEAARQLRDKIDRRR